MHLGLNKFVIELNKKAYFKWEKLTLLFIALSCTAVCHYHCLKQVCCLVFFSELDEHL